MAVRVRVAALVVHDGKVLLVSTKRGTTGYLVPPGGGLEEGETVAGAVAREVGEEAGIAVRPGDLVAYRELQHEGQVTLELYVGAELAANQPLPADVCGEGRQVVWVKPGRLDRVPHFPDQLGELCRCVQEKSAGAVYLGKVQM